MASRRPKRLKQPASTLRSDRRHDVKKNPVWEGEWLELFDVLRDSSR